jgi:hypothetical protein
MKTGLRNFTRIGIMGIIIIGMGWGCTGVGHKIDDWQSALREKLNSNFAEFWNTDGKDGDEVYFIHRSQWSWETLAFVAQWYTGDSKNSKKLADLNPRVNPQKIVVGSKIVIPVSLLETREPLPKNFSRKYRKNYYKHTVRWSGESLSLIASWYTGTHKNWRKLAEANPRLNPSQIKIGNAIGIPPALLKTRVPLPQKVAAKYTSDYFAYKVKVDKEKLEDIARWYTGNSANRNRLAKANPDLNPNHLTKGNEVYIPKKLLKTRRSMKARASKPAVTLAKPAVKTPASEPKTQLAEDENIKLFGPKQFPRQ